MFTKQDIERMLNMARLAGDKDMIRKLTPKKDLRTIKRELIASIRHGKIDQDLWNSYVESINNHNHLTAAMPSGSPSGHHQHPASAVFQPSMQAPAFNHN